MLLLCGLLLAASTPASSQVKAKRSLEHKDYAAWRSLQSPALSPDGRFLVYAVAPQEGDGEFVARNLSTGKEYRHPRGSQPVPAPPSGRPVGGNPPAQPQHLFSPDGKVVAFRIHPPFAERNKEANKDKGKSAAKGNTLGLMTLADGKVVRIDRVRAFHVAEDGPAVLAYYRAPAVEPSDATKGKEPKGEPKGKTEAGPPPPIAGDLVLRNLVNGRERTFADVTEYTLAKNGKWLIYAVGGKKEQGVYAVATEREDPPLVLRSGRGRYSRLSWDEKQTQLVFLHTSAPAAASEKTARPSVRLCYWKPPAAPGGGAVLPAPAGGLAGSSLVALQRALPRASELTPAGKPALKPGYEVSDQGGLSFSLDGGRVFFPVALTPPAKEEKPHQEQAVVELWHHKDGFIQPMQKARYTATPTYRAVFHLDDRTCRQLSDEETTSVLPGAGDQVLGLDDRAYRTLVGVEEFMPPVDVRLINSRTGASKPLAKKQTWPVTLSPGGRYALCYEGKNWHALAIPSGRKVDLTGKLGVSFANELHDSPGAPPPYGVAGWTKDDGHVLVYDRFDVWAIAPDGSGAKNLTRGLGRKRGTVLRLVNLEPNERSFDPARPLLARAENERTRDTGFYRVRFDGKDPKLLIMGARNYGPPVKARKGDKLLLTISTFCDFPDLYLADTDFREVRRVTDVNPQKGDFLWGKAGLIRYKNSDGAELSGVLIKPENFDPKKKYPLLVYIYERLSNRLHSFASPQPGTSMNPTYYASNGYLVLMPDIVYTVGRPGQSAVKCVLPAVQAVVDLGCVDEKAIGIQGHSWGGYQTAYLITQTTRFKAAAAGAPVANMTSAYGGIRWGTGLPRQFQYEKTQSRIGGSLWQYPTRFLENSPLFHADQVKTPLLMLHNDKDEAVPWQQGIEYYLALRRLGREVYLFNYPGEMHGLRKRVNQMDYTVRMQQFFDHHLKGAAKPAWMEKGIPYKPPAGAPEGEQGRPTRRARPRT
jgi:dienelactone hydrolase